MRIIFMGTPEFAVPSLDMLLNEGHDIAAVVTQPDRPKGRGNKLAAPPVKEYAESRGIKVLQPVKVKTPEFAGELRSLGADLFVTAAYGRILTREVLAIPALGCINVHGSLLPRYRGPAPIQRAVINGEKVTGITTMFTDIGMDTGDMLLKSEMPVPDDMTAGELHDSLALLGAQVLRDTLHRLADGTLERTPQNEAEATYAPMVDRDTGTIDWSASARDIHNLVRGTNPWPAAFTYYKGQRMKIWRTAVADEEGQAGTPGTVLAVSKHGMKVAAGKGTVSFMDIQFDSGRRMGMEECWHNLDEGEILGQE